ncbi:ABC transporter permease subunit [Candidatus Stoquefichus massiliensis]|uniref:ABC transporter permease subunit n=1 Tax=Candidatus Stoquefichus massiliensis TaxID=1470350 RepID=UPI00048565A9|nr:ABC transporter permease subunit [Candidatus Stoquefichus massiliensis]
MITVLLKREWKSNYKIFFIFIAVLTLYESLIVAMYDPKLGESLNLMAKSMPQLFAAFGMMDPGLTLLDFITNYLYGFILTVIPLIYTIIMCHRLMARYIDKGSMAYLLTTPHTRTQIMATELMVLLSGVILLIVYSVVLILGCSIVMFSESLNIGKFFVMNIGLLGIHMLFACICFLTTCCFNETKLSIGIGAGIGIGSLLIQMLSQVSDKIDFLKYMTPLTLFNAKGLQVYDQQAVFNTVILFVLAVGCIIATYIIFKNRDLPL